MKGDTRERWRLDRLKANPLQKPYFRDLSAYDLKALAANILLRGLKQPIEVLPDGTVLTASKAAAGNGKTRPSLSRTRRRCAPDTASAGAGVKKGLWEHRWPH